MNNSDLNSLAAVVRSSSILFETASEVIGERSAAESFMVLVSIFDLYRVGQKPISVNEALNVLMSSQGFTERTARIRFERMLDLKLIELLVDNVDRRKRSVHMSESGAEALHDINVKYQERLMQFYRSVGTPEIRFS